MGDEEYRHQRDLARHNRDDDLDDLRWMLAGGDIDDPEKRTRTSRVHNEFGAARRELNMQLRDAPSVGTAATAALEQGPKEFVCARVKGGPKELIPRRGLVSKSLTTYLDLAESALRSLSAENWEQLRSYPMSVETLCDHNEARQSLVVVAIGARQR